MTRHRMLARSQILAIPSSTSLSSKNELLQRALILLQYLYGDVGVAPLGLQQGDSGDH
jgi:hypothetical protein